MTQRLQALASIIHDETTDLFQQSRCTFVGLLADETTDVSKGQFTIPAAPRHAVPLQIELNPIQVAGGTAGQYFWYSAAWRGAAGIVNRP